ncbi:hypothetical protein POM88_052325 [Heracleum sosnowskyi]|uniref:Uncharacterized protein n=1 Tax=Heracleum sosnowskyi TaxID=360622 RepID=A0AAD8LWI5_9APIA|nr:hypothetical protein POM88_052325 [Heracleum sosnowskyi]
MGLGAIAEEFEEISEKDYLAGEQEAEKIQEVQGDDEEGMQLVEDIKMDVQNTLSSHSLSLSLDLDLDRNSHYIGKHQVVGAEMASGMSFGQIKELVKGVQTRGKWPEVESQGMDIIGLELLQIEFLNYYGD